MKKKFITVIPMQPAGKLMKNIYEAVDNERLAYDEETSFPVIPLIAGYTDEKGDIEVIALRHDYQNSIDNIEVFKNELDDLSAKKNFTYSLRELVIPYDNRVSVHTDTFCRLAELVQDEDEINACLTFGTKPLAIIELMTLNYAYRTKKNCSYGALVYGEYDHNDDKAKIYDITSLFIVDELVRKIGEQGGSEPLKVLSKMIK